MKHIKTFGLVIGAVCFGTTAWAQSGAQAVDARSNIFGYGVTTPSSGGGGGVLAPVINLLGVTSRTVTFSATGSAGWAGVLYNGPDGGDFATSTNLSGVGPISGYSGPLSGMLVGVFIEDGDISSLSAPSAIGYSAGDYSSASFAPGVRQVFFIGDGLTGTGSGSAQTFVVPDSASKLVLGIADGFGFSGTPGYYNDNVGGFNVNYEVVPEPATLVALGIGLAALARRRSAKS